MQRISNVVFLLALLSAAEAKRGRDQEKLVKLHDPEGKIHTDNEGAKKDTSSAAWQAQHKQNFASVAEDAAKEARRREQAAWMAQHKKKVASVAKDAAKEATRRAEAKEAKNFCKKWQQPEEDVRDSWFALLLPELCKEEKYEQVWCIKNVQQNLTNVGQVSMSMNFHRYNLADSWITAMDLCEKAAKKKDKAFAEKALKCMEDGEYLPKKYIETLCAGEKSSMFPVSNDAADENLFEKAKNCNVCLKEKDNKKCVELKAEVDAQKCAAKDADCDQCKVWKIW